MRQSSVTPDSEGASARAALRAIKLLHTIVWALFAGCILATPFLALMGRRELAAILSAFVFVEVVVLLANRWRCPLTGVAARYTDDRRDNFDIFLPEWLARHNKPIFGALYIIGICMTAAAWMGWIG